MICVKNIVFATLLSLIMITQVVPQASTFPAGITKIDSIEGITEYRLENGMQVLLIPDASRQNTTVNIIYRVGSRHEGYGETGMAHLLEHLLFRGSPKHPDIPSELTARGASPNGTTWYDRTNYFETFVASDANLEWALDLEADRMINSFISKADLDKEFSVVRNEMEISENDPSRVLLSKVMATAYQWHNYGKTTIGARSDVERVKIANLQAFYRKYYQPDNATLVIGGNFEERKALDLIQKKFGSIPKPARELQGTWTIEPTQDGERQVVVRRAGNTQIVAVGYHAPPASHPDYVPFRILLPVLTDQTNGKLYKAVVESKKATSLTTNIFQNKEPSYGTFEAQLTKDQSAEAVRDIMVSTIESFANEPIPEAEVERMKTASIRSLESAANDTLAVTQALTGWVASGDWKLYFLYRERLKSVTAADVQRVAKNYFLPSNRTVGIFAPTSDPVRAKVPRVEDEEITAMVKTIDRSKTLSAGEVFSPTPANILARTKTASIGGLKTAFLGKENRGDTVTFSMQLHLGDAQSLSNRRLAGILTGRMLNRGTVKKDRQAIRDEMDKIKSRISVFGSATDVEVFVETSRENLPAAIKLAAEMVREPGFPEKDFEQIKADAISRIESQRGEPINLASREMSRTFGGHLPKGHPNYPMSVDEEIAAIKALTLDDLKQFHRDFYGAAGEVAVVGEFDEKQISGVLAEEFGKWTAPKPYSRIVVPGREVASVNKSIFAPDKANAVFLVRMDIPISDKDSDYPALEIANFILGGGTLNSRLATRIRQREGLSYGVGSDLSVSSFEPTSTFWGSASYVTSIFDRQRCGSGRYQRPCRPKR